MDYFARQQAKYQVIECQEALGFDNVRQQIIKRKIIFLLKCVKTTTQLVLLLWQNMPSMN